MFIVFPSVRLFTVETHSMKRESAEARPQHDWSKNINTIDVNLKSDLWVNCWLLWTS